MALVSCRSDDYREIARCIEIWPADKFQSPGLVERRHEAARALPG